MRTILILSLLLWRIGDTFLVKPFSTRISHAPVFLSSGKEMQDSNQGNDGSSLQEISRRKLRREAEKLRKHAEEMEAAMLGETKLSNEPQSLTNLSLKKTLETANIANFNHIQEPVNEDTTAIVATRGESNSDLRRRLESLNVGDAISFSSDLNRLKANNFLTLWDSSDLKAARYAASLAEVKTKTKVDPTKLKLDDIGFNYQSVLVSSVVIGTVSALTSSYIGGQTGFLLGYLSVLFPILVVGVGSVAPSLLGEILFQIRLQFDRELRDRFLRINAGKFLVGYILGLPVLNFYAGRFSNQCEFFQLRPTASQTSDQSRAPKRMFSKVSVSQDDIAAITVVCMAGSVAEYLEYGSASGSNAVDVNLMYELLNSVTPPLPPEKLQDHIRWTVLKAGEILTRNQSSLKRLQRAFKLRLPLADCVAAIEGPLEGEDTIR